MTSNLSNCTLSVSPAVQTEYVGEEIAPSGSPFRRSEIIVAQAWFVARITCGDGFSTASSRINIFGIVLAMHEFNHRRAKLRNNRYWMEDTVLRPSTKIAACLFWLDGRNVELVWVNACTT